jgi:hypothetical protein
VINNDVSNNPPYLLLGRSGAASLGSNTVVVSGSRLGTLTFQGADGASFIEAATVAGEVDGTPGSADMPGRLVFSTTTDGAASPTERMRITSAGLVGVGTSVPGSALDVAGEIRIYPSSGAGNLRFGSGGVEKGKVSVDASSNYTVETAGSERLRIDSTGRLGLGTSSPSATLDVTGNARISGVSGTGYSGLRLFGTGTGYNYLGIDNTGGTSLIGIENSTGGSLAPGTSAYATVLSSYSNTALQFATNNTLRATITSGGNVGIGSTAPSQLLEIKGANARFAVNSTTVADGGILLQGNGTTYAEIKLDASSGILDIAEKQAAGNITFSTGTTPTERVRIDSSGRLLVGTSSALTGNTGSYQSQYSKFVAVGNSAGSAMGFSALGYNAAGTGLANNTGIAVLNFTDNAAAQFASIMCETDAATSAGDYPGRLVFSTTADGASSPTERMRIDNQGRIGFDYAQTTGVINDFGYGGYRGISANTNSTALANQRASWFLRGSMQSTNSEGGNCILLLQDTGGAAITSGDLIKGYSGTTFNFRVANNGAVQNTPNSYGAISDERLKRDIIDAASQWSDIKNIRVRKFRFKDEIEINSAEYIGVVAQEVEQVSPGLIDQAKTEDGEPDPSTFKSVKYSVLYMKAIKALQEAMERIEALEAKVTVLETA